MQNSHTTFFPNNISELNSGALLQGGKYKIEQALGQRNSTKADKYLTIGNK